jgi:PAS domain S-box-containing protein
MTLIRDIPIRHKITLMNVLVSMVTLLLAGSAAVVYELSRLREAAVRDLTTQGQILSANTAAAVGFGDSKAAEEMLSALRTRQDIDWAVILDSSGQPFAQYVRGNAAVPLELKPSLREYYVFEKDAATLYEPVRFGEDVVGTLCLRADLRETGARLRSYAGIAGVVILIALGVSLALSLRLRKVISDPITALASVAREVRRRSDYSLRAQRRSGDEIGRLAEDFNQMLEQIEYHDAALRRSEAYLRASEERFRQLAESIREVFWLTDIHKAEILYVSPGYEAIWGRNRAALINSPREWLEAIHPDDRERVLRNALSRQVAGLYDEEYRIVRPDGSIRWIRDRAFPVRDSAGKVYRIAGIAEDVTERRLLEKQILEISDHEQSRIGQDLHDDLCQHLVSTALAANLLKEDLAARKLPEAAAAAKITNLLNHAIARARRVARGLYPVTVETGGLASALSELAASVSDQGVIDCAFECSEPIKLVDHPTAIHLFRIAQEAVNNAVKHAHATRIKISLSTRDGHVRLGVADNGQGMDEAKMPQGMGLHIMRYRANMIGGTLTISRGEACGTEIICVCELKANPTETGEGTSGYEGEQKEHGATDEKVAHSGG